MSERIKKLFIANRGEIAARIARTAKSMGLESIVGYSDADLRTLAVETADRAARLGPSRAADSYLNEDLVIALAKKCGAEALHPGYGFLSESSEFARKVQAAGLIWVGPMPESMDLVSSKSQAKILARRAGVPVLPGYEGAQDLAALLQAAGEIGYPLLIKAAAGGGGRGIRLVQSDEELREQLPLAAREAREAFGSDEVLLEKYIPEAHHIEVQIFGDQSGTVIHLGERDCSAQRRKQKVIEESPSPVLTGPLRNEITAAAVALARAARYVNAGTVEFLLTPEGKFYFLEMNTRLQVEHTVTEMVTGLDLVELQLRVAAGEPLPLRQEQVKFAGHSIQARLYAEDAEESFRPQAGRIEGFAFPPDIRVDHFLTAGTAISPFYDAMLAKMISFAPTREEAIRKLVAALDETLIAGLKTNRVFLREILKSAFFRAGTTRTHVLDSWRPAKPGETAQPDAVPAVARAAAAVYLTEKRGFGAWTNSPGRIPTLLLADEKEQFAVEIQDRGAFLETRVHGRKIELMKSEIEKLIYVSQPGRIDLVWEGNVFGFLNGLLPRSREDVADPNQVKAPMAGNLVQVRAKAGDLVTEGQVLAIIESMKMQLELRAARESVIESVLAEAGSQVKNKQVLFQMKP